MQIYAMLQDSCIEDEPRRADSFPSVMTTTQSLSSDTRSMTAHNFSTQASMMVRANSPSESAHPPTDPAAPEPSASRSSPRRQGAADDGRANCRQAVAAVDGGAGRPAKDDGGTAADEGVDQHGEQRVWEDRGEEEHGGEFEEPRVPGSEAVRDVGPDLERSRGCTAVLGGRRVRVEGLGGHEGLGDPGLRVPRKHKQKKIPRMGL